MKLLFFSDIHGSAGQLKHLFQQADQRQPDLMILLGDVLYHGPRNGLFPDYDPPETVRLLNLRKKQILAVRGNCDCEVDQMLLEFPILSDSAMAFADGHRFFLTHGHHFNEKQMPPIPDGTVLAHGHTHIPELKLLRNNITIFNPGSISLPKAGNPPSFGWYENNILQIFNLVSGDEMFHRCLTEP